VSSLRLLFCTNPINPLSWLIRAGSWSHWSHVALIDGDSVIEAIAIHGVVRTPLAARQAQDPRWSISPLPCANPAAVIAAASSQIGKPYDYTGVLGVGLHRNWQEDDSWFCSELVAWAFDAGGSALFRPNVSHRVTPQDLWMLQPSMDALQAA
jgi:uncharacterized protein YycO